MSYKIVVDSCCELPEEFHHDDRFEIVPLMLDVNGEQIRDDETFDQKEFLRKVAASPKCPKSSCPSPAAYAEAYECDADRVYVFTLSSKLSGSYNSAVVGRSMYWEDHEDEPKKPIYVTDSESASIGETQLALLAMRLEEEGGRTFAEIVTELEHYRNRMFTYFVLDNLDSLRKNGRLTGVKALIASTLSIKPVMAGDRGTIVQKAKAIGIKKGLTRMAELVAQEVPDQESKTLYMSHCNNPGGAEYVRKLLEANTSFKGIEVFETAGVSSLYANDGGIIIAV